jgi:hypothetical protein
LELGRRLSVVIVAGHVGQIHIAERSTAVPPKHGVDGLAELDVDGLVDAASIDPDVFQPIFPCLLTASAKLDRPDPGLVGPPLFNVTEAELLSVVALRMRQDSVLRGFVVEELLQSASFNIDQAHCRTWGVGQMWRTCIGSCVQ